MTLAIDAHGGTVVLKRFFAFLSIGCLAFVVTLSAENWPAWRGPLANGVSSEKGLPDQVVDPGEHRLEARDAEPQRRDAYRLERSHLPQRRDRDVDRRSRAVGGRSQEGRADLEAAARRRQHQAAEAEHVDAVARHRRHDRLGDDRHRHPQSVRLQGHRALDARHAEGLRARSASTRATPRRPSSTRDRSTSRSCTG